MDHLVVRTVFLIACVCASMSVWSACEQERALLNSCVCVWMCGSVCTHRMPTFRREGDGTPAFCHFNPPYPVTHWSLCSELLDRDQRVQDTVHCNISYSASVVIGTLAFIWASTLLDEPVSKLSTGSSGNVPAHVKARSRVVSETFELHSLLLAEIQLQAGSPFVLMDQQQHSPSPFIVQCHDTFHFN